MYLQLLLCVILFVCLSLYFFYVLSNNDHLRYSLSHARDVSGTDTLHLGVISCTCIRWVWPLPRPFGRPVAGPVSVHSDV